MATITIKINEKTQEGKTFLELVNFFHAKKKSVEIVKEKIAIQVQVLQFLIILIKVQVPSHKI